MFEDKLKENMKDEEELEMLLGEIPHVIHHTYSLKNAHHLHHGHHYNNGDHGSNVMNGMKMMMMGVSSNSNGNVNSNGVYMYDDEPLNHHRYTCASPVSGFSLQSDGSSSSLLSGGGHSLSDNGSPTPPPLDEVSKPYLVSGTSKNFNGSFMDTKALDSSAGKNVNGNVVDEVVLSRNLSKMYIGGQQDDVPIGLSGFQPHDQPAEGAFRMNSQKFVPSVNNRDCHFDYGGCQSFAPFSREMAYCHKLANVSGSRYSPGRSNGFFCPSNYVDPAMHIQFHRTKVQAGSGYQMGIPLSELARSSVTDAALFGQESRVNPFEKRVAFCSPNMPQLASLRPHFDVDNVLRFQQPMPIERNKAFSHGRIPQRGLEAFMREDSLIIQDEGVNCVMNKGYGCPRGQSIKVHSQIAGIQENGRNARMHCAFSLPAKCTSLAEAQGYIYYIAKDQHGCRFLQRMFDEGTPQDVQIIFNEIIDHVVELMMNPFGNYLMQKLLEVCNEEQRMQILLKVTQEPGELVRISLNTHGTRVVQKLIETLKTRQQISLVISALEPGFLALIKDLNGNHVVQRCLQCLSNEDNKFIFVAAAKYSVDIATHQHGCCVLQRCISHSTGEHRETLVAEISANGILLAQDAFGNYVVQFILELKIPSATSKLVSQFEGSYLHLSTQKFSSHVVEKCLAVCNDEIRSTIILELLSATHFEQLLQDPHANYVVQTALRVSEGPIHNSLVDAIETHRAVSRNSPYSKRIFSHKILKK